MTDEAGVHLVHSYAGFSLTAPPPGDIAFRTGKTEVVLHPDGRVTFTGTADQAARDFWSTVEAIGVGVAAENKRLKQELAKLRVAPVVGP